jgi:hypothetical protein
VCPIIAPFLRVRPYEGVAHGDSGLCTFPRLAGEDLAMGTGRGRTSALIHDDRFSAGSSGLLTTFEYTCILDEYMTENEYCSPQHNSTRSS